MLINLSRIKVRTFTYAENPEVAKECFPSLSKEESGRTSIYAVYTITRGIRIIYAYAFEGSKTDVVRDFKDELHSFLSKYNPHTILDCALLLGLFCPVRPEPRIDQLVSYHFRKSIPVDELLKDSRGVLLWDYQLENLIGIFYETVGPDREMYKKIRDGLNQRDPEIEDWTKRLMIDTGLSLFDVFSERTITGNTWRPNIKGAGVLYEALYDAIWRKLEGRD